MAKAKLERVTGSDKPLYGPRKLLLCGFPAGAHAKFSTVLAAAGMESVPVVWASQEHSDRTLAELFGLTGGDGEGVSSVLPRAIIVAGISEKELIRLMTICRKSGMKEALWATLTPTSQHWSLKDLLAELSAERAAFQKKKLRPE